MANEEQPEPETQSGLYASATAATPDRRNQRRKQAIVGATGAAAVLAGVAFLAVQLNDSDQESLPEPAAMAPQTTATSAPAVAADATSAAASVAPSVTRTSKVPKPAATVERSPSPTPSRTRAATPDAAESPALGAVKDLRSKLPLPRDAGAVNERTEALRNGTIRIVTAKRDLTGQRELLLAGDDGKDVGNGVTCTSDVKINAAVPEVQQPTMLLCWRTSKSRSVVTMAVIPKGDPPTEASAEIIDKEWAELD